MENANIFINIPSVTVGFLSTNGRWHRYNQWIFCDNSDNQVHLSAQTSSPTMRLTDHTYSWAVEYHSETCWKSFWHLINLRFIVCIIPPNTPSFLRWTWKCDRGRSPICPMQTSILMIKTCVILFLIFCVIHRHVSNLYVFCWVASNRDLSNQVQTWDNPL